MPHDIAIIVPARVASTRFPRKLLHEVRGVPVILWTARRIRAEAPEFPLIFAVDGEELAAPLHGDGFEVVLTDPALASGTDRVAAANHVVRAGVVVNVQADEPMVTGGQLRQLAGLLQGGVPMATLGSPLEHEHEFLDPNQVKCAPDARGRALFFTRAPMPHFRDNAGRFDAAAAAALPLLIHLGLYAYTADFLARFAALPPGRLEQIERLEMLRVLEAGESIALGVTHDALIEIDTPGQASAFEARLPETRPHGV